MIDLTQAEADILLAVEKRRLNDDRDSFDTEVFVPLRETLISRLISWRISVPENKEEATHG